MESMDRKRVIRPMVGTKTLESRNKTYGLSRRRYLALFHGRSRWYQNVLPCRLQNNNPNKTFIGDDAFCDENGNITDDMPGMRWKVDFFSTATGTKVEVEITFATEADLEAIIEMGFKEGFTAAHGNLDQLLANEVH